MKCHSKDSFEIVSDYLQKEYKKGNKTTNTLSIYKALKGKVSCEEVSAALETLELSGAIEEVK